MGLKELVEQINRLSRKQREQGLSPEEKKEQKELRKIYLKNIRSQITEALDSAGFKPKEKQDGACGCGHCAPHEKEKGAGPCPGKHSDLATPGKLIH